MITVVEISAWVAVGMLIAAGLTMYWFQDPKE